MNGSATASYVRQSQALAHISGDENRAYLRRLDAAIFRNMRYVQKGGGDFFPRLQGAWPTLVIERLNHLGLRHCYSSRLPLHSEPASSYVPELHALDFEWYFTPGFASWFSREVFSPTEVTICIGTPTLVAATDRNDRIKLVDRNPLVLDRFRGRLDRKDIEIRDACNVNGLIRNADCVIFDAPWYLEETLRWLFVASEIVKPGGRIVFALFPTLVRPGADKEREYIISVAAELGIIEETSGLLEYEAPLFERMALSARGVPHPGNWRRGDLVTVHVRNPLPTEYKQRRYDNLLKESWKTFVLHGQVIKVRQMDGKDLDEIEILPVANTFDYIYDSVSIRDPRRPEIGIWTSRNRVARIQNTVAVSQILDRLVSGEKLTRAVEEVCPNASKRSMLVDAMAAILSEV